MSNARWPWAVCAALAFFPLTAIMHHAVFYRPTCILNPFGNEYYGPVVLDWLTHDPSPWLGAALACGLWFVGRRYPMVRPWTCAFVVAFTPLSIWIWDIPFSGRVICDYFHDGRIALRTRHLYVLGMVAWVALSVLLARPHGQREC